MISNNKIKIFITSLILCYSLTAFSQSSNRIKLKSKKYMTVFLDKTGAFDVAGEWEDSINIIVLDIKESSVRIYGCRAGNFDLTTKAEKYTDVSYTVYKWTSCIDKNGLRCDLRLKLKQNSSSKYGLFYIDYTDVTYMFDIKNESNE